MSEPQGDAEDEIDTGGQPLPNKGGVPVATGLVVALVLVGLDLLDVRLVTIRCERRA